MERQDHTDFPNRYIDHTRIYPVHAEAPIKKPFGSLLAAGTIGGLIMSILGIFFYLPIFTLKKERH